MTQYHHGSTITALYWSSATKYQQVEPHTDPVPSCINQYRLLLTQYHQVPNSTAFCWTSTIIYQPVPLHIDPVPPSINQYQPILTQYHQVPTSTASYWPSTTKYQPVPPPTDPVPPSTHQYHLLLTQCHHISTSTASYWPSTTKYQPVPTYTVFAWGLQTPAQFTPGLVCYMSHFCFIDKIQMIDILGIIFLISGSIFPETIIFSSLISYVDLNESISNDWTFMKRQIKPPLKLIGRENTDNIILVERNVDMWGEALRSSNPVSQSSRTNMAIQTLQLQLKVITVITKVARANQVTYAIFGDFRGREPIS